MDAFFGAITSILPEMPAWILASTGFYFAYRIMNFPDITVDGSFVAGSVAAATVAFHSASSLGGLFLSIILGLFSGSITCLIYLIYPRNAYKMLSGIFVVLGLYSLNFRLLDHRTELSFGYISTGMNQLNDFEIQNSFPVRFLLGLGIILFVDLGLWYLLKTKFGLILRSVGTRPKLEGLKPRRFLLVGIALANILVGIGGWFYASVNSYARISVFGTIIHALAISIIGEMVIGSMPFLKDKRISPSTILLTPIVGSIIYLFVKGGVYFLMVDPQSELVSINQQDMNAVVALLLIVILILVRFFKFLHKKFSIDDYETELVGEL